MAVFAPVSRALHLRNPPGMTPRGAGDHAPAALALIALCAGALLLYAWRPRPVPPPVDTELRSGSHLTLVVVAPTGDPDAGYAAMIDSARNSMRRFARASGYQYSTIGVSDDWSIERGLKKLQTMGPFDEIIVGRNWLNTGIESFVTDLGGVPGVPQLFLGVREISTDTIPFEYGAFRELLRLVGRSALMQWVEAGCPINADIGVRRWNQAHSKRVSAPR